LEISYVQVRTNLDAREVIIKVPTIANALMNEKTDVKPQMMPIVQVYTAAWQFIFPKIAWIIT
jgi:hypothetical protein